MDPIALYQCYYPVIYQQIRGCVSQHEQAEDLTQDTFVKALCALDRAPEAPGDLRRWLGCIARNTVLDYRKHVRCIMWTELCENSAMTTNDCSETVVQHLHLQEVLSTLPACYRQVLLAATEGYTSPEIAVHLGISRYAAKVRLTRARQKLKQRYLATQTREVSRG